MPSTVQGLRHVMPGNGAESNKGDEAKSEAKACEGKGSEAIEKGSCGYIIEIMEAHSNYDSSRHTQHVTPPAQEIYYKLLKFGILRYDRPRPEMP